MGDPGKEQRRDEIVQWFHGICIAGRSDDMLGALETDILPRYLVERRWYGAKDAGLPRVRFEQLIPLGGAHEAARLGILEVEPPSQGSQRYLLPLIVVWGDADRGTAPIAAVVCDGIHGALLDACFADEFVYDLLRAIMDDKLEHVLCDRRVLVRGMAALRACGDLTSTAIERSTDVAGMLRSFAYASAATQRNLGEQGVDGDAERQLASWSADMSAEFLDSYRTAIRGCAGYPDSECDANRLLRLFLLEKALYEIAYEGANRPDWIDIPIAGALALLDQE